MCWVVGSGLKAFRELEKGYRKNATIGLEEAAQIAAAIDPRLQVRVAAFSKRVIGEDTEEQLIAFCNKVKEEMKKDYPDYSFFGALSFYPFRLDPEHESVIHNTWSEVVSWVFNDCIHGISGKRKTDGDCCFAILFARKDLYREDSGQAPSPPEKRVYIVCETNLSPDSGWPCAVFSDWEKAGAECLRLAENTREVAEETHRDIVGVRKARRTARFYVERVEQDLMHGYGVKVKKIGKDGSETEGEWDTIFYVDKYVLDRRAFPWGPSPWV